MWEIRHPSDRQKWLRGLLHLAISQMHLRATLQSFDIPCRFCMSSRYFSDAFFMDFDKYWPLLPFFFRTASMMIPIVLGCTSASYITSMRSTSCLSWSIVLRNLCSLCSSQWYSWSRQPSSSRYQWDVAWERTNTIWTSHFSCFFFAPWMCVRLALCTWGQPFVSTRVPLRLSTAGFGVFFRRSLGLSMWGNRGVEISLFVSIFVPTFIKESELYVVFVLGDFPKEQIKRHVEYVSHSLRLFAKYDAPGRLARTSLRRRSLHSTPLYVPGSKR